MATPPPSPDSDGYTGAADVNSATSDLNGMAFVASQVMGAAWTAMAVKVVTVTPGGVGSTAKVDVLPLVNQIDGTGAATPHGTIYGLPVMRMQGGVNALIVDPEAGDIGLVVFCHSDISTVATTKAQANPGSRRKFDPADGIYVGSLFGAVTPTRYVIAKADGITINAPDQVTIEAPTINLKGAVVGTSTAVFSGDVTGQGTSLHTHVHSGVTAGGSPSGPPV